MRLSPRPDTRPAKWRQCSGSALAAVVLGLVVVGPAKALDRVYLAPEAFIASALEREPQPKVLWLTSDMPAEIKRIVGHAPTQLRQRYWTDGRRTAWILEEIGKEDLITAGFVVESGRIGQARVLVYRESRGMEVRYAAFVDQFKGAALTEGNRLDRAIDGIAGATLSVGAMERMARLALYFDQKSRR